MPSKNTLWPLLFGCAASFYIISDTLITISIFIVPSVSRIRFFSILRELSPMLFSVLMPYYLYQIQEKTAKIKMVNRSLMWMGALSTAVIALYTVLFYPEIAITIDPAGRELYTGITYRTGGLGPILIIRDIIIISYLLYTIFFLLYNEIKSSRSFQSKKIFAGLVVMVYFVSVYLYSIFFISKPGGGEALIYPHFSLGLAILLIFMTAQLIDIIVYYQKQLAAYKNDFIKHEYYDRALSVPNKICFIRDIQKCIDDARTGGAGLYVIIMDLDNFQSLNEFYGDAVGDEILKKLSSRLINLFKNTSTLYRVGGDDFAFLLHDIQSLPEAETLARKIISSFRNPFHISGATYLVTSSLGILQLPRDGEKSEVIFKNAYATIRKAKMARNTYEVFSGDLIDESNNKIHSVNILRECLFQDQFTMFYQPIVDSNENIVHAEALLRCTRNNPDIGGPGIFIPLLEKAGLSKEVDNMVIRKTFQDVETHIKKKFKVSINLSTEQMVNPKYSEFLVPFAGQHSLNPSQFILEVTENKLMENLSLGRESLMMLKNSGFNIALDDFGKGFSSLVYLSELPVDYIKLDMVFVQSVPGSKNKESMVRHIVHLAHSLGLKIIAEGFESREQFDFFRELGCDLYQGYLFSRPVSLHELISKYFPS